MILDSLSALLDQHAFDKTLQSPPVFNDMALLRVVKVADISSFASVMKRYQLNRGVLKCRVHSCRMLLMVIDKHNCLERSLWLHPSQQCAKHVPFVLPSGHVDSAGVRYRSELTFDLVDNLD